MQVILTMILAFLSKHPHKEIADCRATRICWLKSSLESHIHPVSLRIADADELDVV